MLDLISSEDEERYERAVNLCDSKRYEILEEIKENLFDHSFELLDAEGDVNEVRLGDVELIDEPLITEIEDSRMKFVLQISFDFIASCSVFDEDSSPYDSETKEYLWKTYKDEEYHRTEDIEVKIDLLNVNFNKLNEEDIDFEIEQINNGEPIFIYNDYY
ncbi:hypothetical protein [Bacillus haynesii]|uniref:hypothetical protein n=1 Tax=Bacillus haynesii TaxID=1925021 RepID=UPI0022806127|nr:hypothetical protein [Bacillus haynesii]MCY8757238.1 hypothetical protein [Bacillus haynesii]